LQIWEFMFFVPDGFFVSDADGSGGVWAIVIVCGFMQQVM
jgi:hypothetical protein